ncbi:MAG: restriction endonuclease subunit S [Candidatus Omnitrophota bacterium]|nr:restriction endonuclease subunit S [Candidatus Omnitrophota bacterium]
MKLNYNKLGQYIKEVNERNSDLAITKLIGVSMEKTFISSVANIVDTDMSVYKILKKGQLACKLMSVGRDEKLPVDLYKNDEPAIVSSAYYVFEPIDNKILLSEYLFMWLCRPENDRYIGFISGGDVRGGISWETFCDIPIKVPHPAKQKEIVKEYNAIVKRIAFNSQFIQKLEETAQAIYKQWFVDFEFPNESRKPYRSNNGEMEFNEKLEREIPKGWKVDVISKLVTVKDGTHDSPEPTEVGHPLVTSTHLNLYDLSLNETYNISAEDFNQANKRSKVDKHDILFSMIGTIGLVNYVLYDNINFAIKNVGLFKTSERKEVAEYILYFLKSDYLKLHIQSSLLGSTQNYVTLDFLRTIPILIPSNNIFIQFEECAGKIVNNIYLKVKENNALKTVKNLLLSKLATIEN